MIYEYQKGKESFYWPYLDLLPDVDFFCYWKQEDMFSVQDLGLIYNSIKFKREVDAEYRVICMLMRRYPQVFNETSLSLETFLKFYN